MSHILRLKEKAFVGSGCTHVLKGQKRVQGNKPKGQMDHASSLCSVLVPLRGTRRAHFFNSKECTQMKAIGLVIVPCTL